MEEVTVNEPQGAEFYHARYEIYKSFYPALKPSFRAIAELYG